MTQWDTETLQEEIDEAIGDSIDMDWTSAIGARHVMGIPVIAAVPAMVQALRISADTLDRYADFIRLGVAVDDLECHPYLPGLEQEIADIRAILQRIDGET